MSFFGHKINAPLPDASNIPDEWFLSLEELNKKKEYISEGWRKETAKQIITEMVKKEKDRRTKK